MSTKIDPNYYLLNCARQYAATLRQLRDAPDEGEQRRHLKLLHYLMEAAMDEMAFERRRRHWVLPDDVANRLVDGEPLPADRTIDAQEAELVRYACSVLPLATMDNLSGEDLLDLADMFEGFAQDDRFDGIDIARLLGWSDGYRALARAIGSDYEPPAKAAGEPDSLLKFLANRMKGAQ